MSFTFSHGQMRGATMSLAAAVRGFVVFLFVSVVQNQNGWGVTYTSTQICALKGSTVEISCTYIYPSRINYKNRKIQRALWFSKGNDKVFLDLKKDPDYTGRLEHHCYQESCTLKITGLKERDSAMYKFMFITNQPYAWYAGLPGVAVSVTDLQVQVIKLQNYSDYVWVELRCHSSCLLDHPAYVWMKNGQDIYSKTAASLSSFFYPTDWISCAVKGHEKFPSPSVYAPKLPSVSVSPSAEIVEGSSVTLTCSSDANPAANYTWYKEDGHKPLSEDSQLVFSSIQSSDSGQYYCTAGNKLGMKKSGYKRINVKYAPKCPSVSVSPSAEIVEGSSVTLTCSSDANPAANCTWYKEDEDSAKASGQNFTITDIRPEHSGSYYCVAQNTRGYQNSTLQLTVVADAPKLPSVSVSPSAEIVEGSSVTLTCSSDANPAANYTWYKEDEDSPITSGDNFTITDFRPEHSGSYYCVAQNTRGRQNSTPERIHLHYAPKLPSVSVSPSAEIVEGSSVTLTCSSDANPAANYTWYKEDGHKPLSEDSQLVFSSIQSSDSGQYYCTAGNKLGMKKSGYKRINVKYAPKCPSVSVSPSAEIVEGSSVTLTCSSDANPAANCTWYKEDEDSAKASGQNFTITDIRPEHSGSYYCVAQNTRGYQNSTLQLTVVAVFSVFLWIRKRGKSKESAESEDQTNHREQRQLQEQDDLQYASIHFNNQADPLYSNMRAAQPRRHTEEQEVAEYTAVRFNRGSEAKRGRSHETEESSCGLYATVNKT
ncbi:B-cell receptor CD22-like [Archocentrus centrarchus]|uniref:B-cell receptor CD22-like n=1 Tax=Archocentrus centrarchus TaxID=63155 RepID=UPI0011E9D3D0|nr:B-cell receptor CD22-like [Archocentrus centrarchus]